MKNFHVVYINGTLLIYLPIPTQFQLRRAGHCFEENTCTLQISKNILSFFEMKINNLEYLVIIEHFLSQVSKILHISPILECVFFKAMAFSTEIEYTYLLNHPKNGRFFQIRKIDFFCFWISERNFVPIFNVLTFVDFKKCRETNIRPTIYVSTETSSYMKQPIPT